VPIPDFVYNGRATRVVFGNGRSVHLERELLALGAQRALVLCSPEQHALGASVVEQLGSHSAGLFDRAAMHGPLELAAEAQTVEASLGAH